MNPPGRAQLPVGRLSAADWQLEELEAVVTRTTTLEDHPFADRVADNVVVYEAGALEKALGDPDRRAGFQAEVARVLLTGPGVALFEGAFAGSFAAATAEATEAFRELVQQQRRSGAEAGDHFAPPGANDRIWEALGKLATRRPETFTRYYANDVLAAVLEAYLGPGYQIVSDVNVVNPGAGAQVPHRDYHLGFMSPEAAAAYPAHVHAVSPTLTLQAAVAHCDMPVATGPTLYLPYSQLYLPGFVGPDGPEWRRFFATHRVQPALREGDLAVFNPAVFHAAGANHSAGVHRIANLLQVSSAFGRPMDAVDREAICRAVYPVLLELQAGGAPERALRNVVAAAADGYAFPTNLDRDPPTGGLAPPSQAAVVWEALLAGRHPDQLAADLAAYRFRHTA